VLEIGCGWGALAEKLIRRYGASVLGITLSIEQLAYARTRLAGEAAEGRADLRLLDYRDVSGKFDRIVSIEMIEAVGERYWPNYFGKLRNCLVSGGVAVLQAITIDEQRFAAYRKTPDFIQRYIFPGGVLPTRSIIEQEAARAGLKLVHHESFGDSYVKTLREWRTRFLQAWPQHRNARLQRALPAHVGILSRLLRSRFQPRHDRRRLLQARRLTLHKNEDGLLRTRPRRGHPARGAWRQQHRWRTMTTAGLRIAER
jgi:cyclopropane fatty-acyl-phospholipid synthase-like methyltransferase